MHLQPALLLFFFIYIYIEQYLTLSPYLRHGHLSKSVDTIGKLSLLNFSISSLLHICDSRSSCFKYLASGFFFSVSFKAAFILERYSFSVPLIKIISNIISQGLIFKLSVV